MADYDSIDLDFTWDGDYVKGDDGDLGDTAYDLIQSFINEVRTIVQGDFGDWEKHPGLTADLSDYKGEPNTRDTGNSIQQRVRSKLVASRIVRPEDLSIRIVPIHMHSVLIIITVQAVATPRNSLKLGQPIQLKFLFDSSEHDILFIPPSENERLALR